MMKKISDGNVLAPLLLGIGSAWVFHSFLKIFLSKPFPGDIPLIPIQKGSLLSRFFLGHLVDFMGEEAFAWHERYCGLVVNKEKKGDNTTPLRRTENDTEEKGEGEFIITYPIPLQHKILNQARVFLRHPQDALYVLHNADNNIIKPSNYERIGFIIGRGLLSMVPDEEHAAQRKHVGPAFAPKALSTIADETVRVQCAELIRLFSEAAVEHQEDDSRSDSDGKSSGQTKGLEFKDLISSITLNVIADAAFNMTDSESEQFRPVVKKSLDRMPFTILIPGFQHVPVAVNRKVNANKRVMMEATKKIVQRTKQAGQPKEGEARSLIDYLVFNEKLSFNQIFDHSLTFVFAGHETTATAMTWMVYALSNNTKIQDRLYDELTSLIAPKAVCTLNDLKQCRFLLSVIRETLRLYPPASQFSRTATKDLVLPGSKTFVPKGYTTVVCTFLMHREPCLWGQDALEFRPERWEEDPTLEERMTSSGAYMPFSVGRRNCIGKDFAMNELLLLAAALYRNFRVTLVEGQEPVRRRFNITMGTWKPFRVNVIERSE